MTTYKQPKFILRHVLDAELDGYCLDGGGRRRLAIRLRLSCGHDVIRYERPRRSEYIRARCYLCAGNVNYS